MAKPRDDRQPDLLRPTLDQIIDMGHPLVRLAERIDWSFLEHRFAGVCRAGAGQPPLPTRLVAGLMILKHAQGLSDEALCARWVENPYFQYLCGEVSFCHRLPFDRSSLTRWRQRLGEAELEALLAESGALRQGHFRLSSGLHSPAYVQCALLLELPERARRVGAALARERVGLEPQAHDRAMPGPAGRVQDAEVAHTEAPGLERGLAVETRELLPDQDQDLLPEVEELVLVQGPPQADVQRREHAGHELHALDQGLDRFGIAAEDPPHEKGVGRSELFLGAHELSRHGLLVSGVRQSMPPAPRRSGDA